MNIRVNLNTNIADGSEVVFRSPADCSQVTGLVIYHNGGKTEFAFADAHGNNVGDIDHLFAENAVVKVILDVTASMAFVQNADTNAYIERTFVKSVNGQTPDKKGNVAIKLPEGGNSTPGKDGGYYVPTVEQVSETEAEVSFVPSDSNMPVIPKVSLKLPVGPPGDPGNTPVVSVSPITGGHRITITNASGTKTVDVMDGVDGDPGKNGGFYVPNVEQVATDTIRMSFTATGTENMPVQQPVVLKLPQGPRGDSYILTDADKSEITRLVIESLGGNPIFGYVDANNNIVVSGHLGDGRYSVKYEMEDGSLLPIGDLEIDNTIEYSVACNLTNCINTNGAVEIAQGASYTATITPNSGYALQSVSVTMGGTDITASAVNGSNISIEEVTGDIVITAVAEATLEPTNFLDTSSADFKTGSRISNSGTNGITTGARVSVTNYIQVETGDIIVLANCSSNSISNLSGSRFAVYTGTTHSTRVATSEYSTTNSYMKTLENNKFEVVGNSFAYVRFTIGDYGEDVNKVTIHIQRNGEWL